jgi:hypothetical protein
MQRGMLFGDLFANEIKEAPQDCPNVARVKPLPDSASDSDLVFVVSIGAIKKRICRPSMNRSAHVPVSRAAEDPAVGWNPCEIELNRANENVATTFKGVSGASGRDTRSRSTFSRTTGEADGASSSGFHRFALAASHTRADSVHAATPSKAIYEK